MNTRARIFISLVGLIAFSCNRDDSNPVVVQPPAIVPTLKARLHGSWLNTTYNYSNQFFRYDSISSTVVQGGNEGYNFRMQGVHPATVDSVQISGDFGNGTYERWYLYQFSTDYDTLILYYDSVYSSPMRFVRTSITTWVETIPRILLTTYPLRISRVRAFAYADSCWYILTGGVLYRIRVGTMDTCSFSFPTASAMDVADGFLWLAGNFYIDKRRLSDTVLVGHYEIAQHFTGNDGNNWIQGMAVSGNTIYMMASWDRFLVFSSNGMMQRIDSTFVGLGDLMVVGERLWGVAGTDVIYEIDPITLRAARTYLLVYPHLGSYTGIAFRDGQIVCADSYYGYFRTFELATP